ADLRDRCNRLLVHARRPRREVFCRRWYAGHSNVLGQCRFTVLSLAEPRIVLRSTSRSIPKREPDFPVIEIRRTVCSAVVEPVLLVGESHRVGIPDIPAHAGTDLIGEIIDTLRALIRSAHVAPPRIPPAADLNAAIRDVRVDESPSDTAIHERRDRTFHEVEVEPYTGRDRFH